ncbi:MAG: IS1 family transposase [Bryobacteraceae bacterium]
MNRLDADRRAQVVRCLVEGNSIRSTVRITGVAKNTVAKLLVELGTACTKFMDEAMRNLPCQRLQCDEIWSFVYAKEKNVTAEIAEKHVAGSVWTWTAIDADSKLIPSWFIGKRDAGCATEFMQDLASRLANRVQITTDGLKVYLNAILDAFSGEIDYSILHKVYGQEPANEARYSPARCIGCEKKTVLGNPDEKHISTSYVERANLSMRMSMRRFTRLTNAFSKKLDNHAASVAIYFTWYNFGRVHQTLKMTPAMKAGIANHAWTVSEMVELLSKVEPKSTRPAVSN